MNNNQEFRKIKEIIPVGLVIDVNNSLQFKSLDKTVF